MRTFIESTQDATIYERYPTLNAGLDEILEIGKNIKSTDGSGKYASGSCRILLNFDIPSHNQYPSGSTKYYLNLRIANAKNVNRYQQIEIYPISSSWIEGSGYFYQDYVNVGDGVSWEDSTKDVRWNTSGSDYTTDITSSYTFTSVPIEDVKIDVTNIIAPVVTGSNVTPWNGILLKFPAADETSSLNLGNIKFFSGNTHTIFKPLLEVAYVDQTFTTGSLKPIPSSNVSIIPKNIKESYTRGEIDKIYFVVRDKYPDKRFDSVQRYRTQYYLPSESYCRIKDQTSGLIIYDFDQYSALNCDVSGSYFILDTTAFDVNRYYTLELKIKSGNLVFFPELDYSFKIDNDE